MDSRTPERSTTPDAAEFVRFCYHRRRVGWPELYDEMCAVAHRGLYRGWGVDELGTAGIGFSLFELPSLAVLVRQVIAEEQERRLLARAAVAKVARAAAIEEAPTEVATATLALPATHIDRAVDRQPDTGHDHVRPLRFAGATA
jgi:hypothetical protein